MNREEIIEAIKAMNVLELSQLVKDLEEIFGVSAAAPMMAMPVAGGAAPAAEQEEEQTEFDAVLTDFGAEKIKVIKVVRELTGLGLKEAKDLVDGAPSKIREGVSKEAAQEVADKLSEVGAKVEVK